MSNFALRNERDNSNSTKIMLTNVDLTENVAVMTCTKISATLQCTRCKTKCNVMTISNKLTISNQCSKCHKVMSFKFEAAIIHQFSTLLGFLSISDCQVVDINVVECDFSVDCLNCTKQIAINGIHYGQKYKTCCFSCNQKVALIIGGVKLLPSKPSGKLSTWPTKTEKKSKDIVIQQGEPLPDFGICKHYKKSYRWLRFPCCGKIFSCDVCHNEKEVDHEMKFASRMICGFCSKEQPYTKDKPCVSCTSSMTKMSTAHWEGGKGCRNKAQLSRSDKGKYSGMNKTTSKKAQDLENEKKKR